MLNIGFYLGTTCRDKQDHKGLTLVDQSEFLFPFDSNVSMHPEAVLYIPRQCRTNSSLCSLHVAFHGCRHSMCVIEISFETFKRLMTNTCAFYVNYVKLTDTYYI